MSFSLFFSISGGLRKGRGRQGDRRVGVERGSGRQGGRQRRRARPRPRCCCQSGRQRRWLDGVGAGATMTMAVGGGEEGGHCRIGRVSTVFRRDLVRLQYEKKSGVGRDRQTPFMVSSSSHIYVIDFVIFESTIKSVICFVPEKGNCYVLLSTCQRAFLFHLFFLKI